MQYIITFVITYNDLNNKKVYGQETDKLQAIVV